MKQFWQSFTGRMMLGALAIQALLTPLLFYGILFFIQRGFETQFVDQVRNNTYLYAHLMESAVAEAGDARQRAILEDAVLNEDLLLAEFESIDGTVSRPDADERFAHTEFLEDFGFAQHNDDVYFMAIPLHDAATGELLGSLRMGYDETPTLARIAAAYRYGAVLAAGYALLSVMMVIFFGHRLVRPLYQLRDMARMVQGGAHATTLHVNTDIPEIDQLASALDSMRQRLTDKHAEAEDREQRLHAILDNAGEGIISFDASGEIRSFNRAAERIFGYQASQAIGKNVSSLIPVPDKESFGDLVHDLTLGPHTGIDGNVQQVDARHQNGRLIPVSFTVTEVWLDRQELYIGIVRDLATEVAKERQLLKFQRVVEQSPVSIVITDTNGAIEYVNPHFCQVTGYRLEEVLGANPRILKSGNTKVDTYRQLWTTITRGDVWHGIFQNRKKNGELFWESATICPVHEPDQNITHYIALKEDITEHRNKDRMLTQAMKLEVVGRMTDGIAHDFNNLLTIIMGNLQCLQEGNDRQDHAELIDDAISAATDGADLIRQLLVFARREDPVSKPVEITAFMHAVRPLLKRALPQDVVMTMEISEDVGAVHTDEIRLESAILNLAINAGDAMPDGGELQISARRAVLLETAEVADGCVPPGDYVLIGVADTGTGMTEDVLKQAVEPFFTTKAHTSGTGLGLSMVNDLVTQNGGGIRIESKPGQGTVVTLLIPLCEQPAALPQPGPADKDHLPGGEETILIVEDRAQVRRFARRVLRQLGYNVFEAENAREAVVFLQSNGEIDLLFTDIVMPGDMDGRDLASYALSCRPTLRVLLTTGIKFEAANSRGTGRDYRLLPKPYSISQLAYAIRDLLNDRPDA